MRLKVWLDRLLHPGGYDSSVASSRAETSDKELEGLQKDLAESRWRIELMRDAARFERGHEGAVRRRDSGDQ